MLLAVTAWLTKIKKSKYLWYALGSLIVIFALHKAIDHYILQYKEKTTTAAVQKLVDDANAKDQQIKALQTQAVQSETAMNEHKKIADDLQVKADTYEQLYHSSLGNLKNLEKPVAEYKWTLEDCKTAYKNLSDASVVTTDEATKTIDEKNEALKEMNVSLTNCFDASATLTKALSVSEAKSSDYEKGLDLQQGLTASIKADLEKESHRKWWYLLGGVIGGVVAKKEIH